MPSFRFAVAIALLAGMLSLWAAPVAVGAPAHNPAASTPAPTQDEPEPAAVLRSMISDHAFYLQLLAGLGGFATLVFTWRQQINAKREEIYQNLEMASIELFRFEIDHIQIARYIWEDQDIPAEIGADPQKRGDFEYKVVQFLAQVLNLFEMSTRFRKRGIVPRDVFGSWIEWMYELCQSKRFVDYWECGPEGGGLRLHYVGELRDLLDAGMGICGDETTTDEEKERRFFERAAALFPHGWLYRRPDPIIRHWLRRCGKTTAPAAAHRDAAAPQIAWCGDANAAPVMADFFADNVDPAYISHGELQDGRALSLTQWSPRLREIMTRDFQAACTPSGTGSRSRVAAAQAAGRIVAVALVDIDDTQHFAVLHDLVVAEPVRGQGIGSVLLNWVEAELKRDGVRNLFIESGVANHAAHHFFHERGFRKCSVNMVKPLQ